MAPGGDLYSVKAAIVAGADAVYCGLSKFNARNRAANIDIDHLHGLVRIAHAHNCKVFITLNIMVVESEIPSLVNLLNRVVNVNVDGVIVQDLGLLYILNKYFRSIEIHASTQMTTHNRGQLLFLKRMNVSRVNLARELSLKEIQGLCTESKKLDMETEVFVHGSYCISFSGVCYMSSVLAGRSGNRGKCSQPCRDRYQSTPIGNNFPLNLKDNSAYFNLDELHAAGVDSLKVEGRMKEADYVFTVISAWRNQLDHFYETGIVGKDNTDLYKVFNRDFSNGFLRGDISNEMFIDNPMSHSTKYFAENGSLPIEGADCLTEKQFFDEKEDTRCFIKDQIAKLKTEEIPLSIFVAGKQGDRLELKLQANEVEFVLQSKNKLSDTGNEPITRQLILNKLKAINDTGYFIGQLHTDELSPKLFLPFSDIKELKKEILQRLIGKKYSNPIRLPKSKRTTRERNPAKLSVLISDPKNIEVADSSVDIFFQLPNAMATCLDQTIAVFEQNPHLLPWFPAILIGEDYDAAVSFLETVEPQKIISDNSGIGHEAYKRDMHWIAGTAMNVANSYSLRVLKENFDCAGAFISNEISKGQLAPLQKPAGMDLYYCILHPNILMTSRQCLFFPVTGCHKNKMDESCVTNCQRRTIINSVDKEVHIIEKSKGNLHRLFHSSHYLNTKIVSDFNHLFSNYLIDLRDIKTETVFPEDKWSLLPPFSKLINGEEGSGNNIHRFIQQTCSVQYERGV